MPSVPASPNSSRPPSPSPTLALPGPLSLPSSFTSSPTSPLSVFSLLRSEFNCLSLPFRLNISLRSSPEYSELSKFSTFLNESSASAGSAAGNHFSTPIEFSAIDLQLILRPLLSLAHSRLSQKIPLLAIKSLQKLLLTGILTLPWNNSQAALGQLISGLIKLNVQWNSVASGRKSSPAAVAQQGNKNILKELTSTVDSPSSPPSSFSDSEADLLCSETLSLLFECFRFPPLHCVFSDSMICDYFIECFTSRARAPVASILYYTSERYLRDSLFLLFHSPDLPNRSVCLHRIFRFLSNLMNPSDHRNDEEDILFGLEILQFLINSSTGNSSSSSSFLLQYPILYSVLQDEFSPYILLNSQSKNMKILGKTTRIVLECFLALLKADSPFKLQLEVFFSSIHLRIGDSASSSQQMKEIVLSSAVEFTYEFPLLCLIYHEFDMADGKQRNRLYNDLIQFLSSYGIPHKVDSELNNLNFLGLEGLERILIGIAGKYANNSGNEGAGGPAGKLKRGNSRLSLALLEGNSQEDSSFNSTLTGESGDSEELQAIEQNWSNSQRLSTAIQKFNQEGIKSFKYIQSIGRLFPSGPISPAFIARFLHLPGIDLWKLNETLFLCYSEDFQCRLWLEYIKLMDFHHYRRLVGISRDFLSLDEALRIFVNHFRFPEPLSSSSSASNSSVNFLRCLEYYCSRYWEYCSNGVSSPASLLTLAYSLFLLSGSQWQLNEFDRLLRGGDDGADFSASLLKSLYDSVHGAPLNIQFLTVQPFSLSNSPAPRLTAANPVAITPPSPHLSSSSSSSSSSPHSHRRLLSEAVFRDLLHRSHSSSGASQGRDMFLCLWTHSIALFASFIEHRRISPDHQKNVFSRVQRGVESFVKICAKFQLTDCYNNLLIALSRCFCMMCEELFSSTAMAAASGNSANSGGISPAHLAAAGFARDSRLIFTSQLLFSIIHQYSSGKNNSSSNPSSVVQLSIQEAWPNIINSILYLLHLNIFPQHLWEFSPSSPASATNAGENGQSGAAAGSSGVSDSGRDFQWNLGRSGVNSLKSNVPSTALMNSSAANGNSVNSSATPPSSSFSPLKAAGRASSNFRSYLAWGYNSLLSTISEDRIENSEENMGNQYENGQTQEKTFNHQNHPESFSAIKESIAHAYEHVESLGLPGLFQSSSTSYSPLSLQHLIRCLILISSYISRSSNLDDYEEKRLYTSESAQFACEQLFFLFFFNLDRDGEIRYSPYLWNHLESVLLRMKKEPNYYLERLLMNGLYFNIHAGKKSMVGNSSSSSLLSYRFRLFSLLLGISQESLEYFSTPFMNGFLQFLHDFSVEIHEKNHWDIIYRILNTYSYWESGKVFSALLGIINSKCLQTENFPGMIQALYFCIKPIEREERKKRNGEINQTTFLNSSASPDSAVPWRMALETLVKVHHLLSSFPLASEDFRSEGFLVSIQHFCLLIHSSTKPAIRRAAFEELFSLVLSPNSSAIKPSPRTALMAIEKFFLPVVENIHSLEPETVQTNMNAMGSGGISSSSSSPPSSSSLPLPVYDLRVHYMNFLFKCFLFYSDVIVDLPEFPLFWLNFLAQQEKFLFPSLFIPFIEAVRNSFFCLQGNGNFQRIYSKTGKNLLEMTRQLNEKTFRKEIAEELKRIFGGEEESPAAAGVSSSAASAQLNGGKTHPSPIVSGQGTLSTSPAQAIMPRSSLTNSPNPGLEKSVVSSSPAARPVENPRVPIGPTPPPPARSSLSSYSVDPSAELLAAALL